MSHGIVAAGHDETALAAIEILEAGGNAFDAIVAAGFAAPVAEPILTSLGGGGFLLAHNAQGLERLYDFFVQTPRQRPDPKTLDFYPINAEFGTVTQEFHIGLGSVATPGMIAGLFEVHQDLGSLPILEVMGPAIRLCREGIPINAFQEYLFEVVRSIYSATPEAQRVFGSKKYSGQLVRAGETFKLPELADTLEALAREGRELFYRGELARKLVDQCKEGGALQYEDLSSYRVMKRKPLEFIYQGQRLLTNPPPSSGGVLIAFALEILEKVDAHSTTFGSFEDLNFLAHAMELTNKARMDAWSKEEDWEGASRVLFNEEFLRRYQEMIPHRPAANRGTTHINVIDGEGNVASMSMSAGEGCGHILQGTGIMLNNMLGEEDINPEGFHSWPTDQRMASMMAPSLMFHHDGTMVAVGSGGSNRIRTAIVQVLRNLIHHKMSFYDAVNSPRIHYEREQLNMEPGFAGDVVQALQREFPDNVLWKDKNMFFGGVHGVSSHPSRGFQGAGDPRRSGVVRQK